MKKVGFVLLAVLAIIIVSITAWAKPTMQISTTSMWGDVESWIDVSIDPPGYPDYWDNDWDLVSNHQSHISLDLDGKTRLSTISRGAIDPGQTWTALGHIWSGMANQQDFIGVSWSLWDNQFTWYEWSIDIQSADGSPVWSSGLINASIASGSIQIPVLRTEDWLQGYSATIVVYNPNSPAVPEPSSLLALGTGAIGLLGVIRRRRVS